MQSTLVLIFEGVARCSCVFSGHFVMPMWCRFCVLHRCGLHRFSMQRTNGQC